MTFSSNTKSAEAITTAESKITLELVTAEAVVVKAAAKTAKQLEQWKALQQHEVTGRIISGSKSDKYPKR